MYVKITDYYNRAISSVKASSKARMEKPRMFCRGELPSVRNKTHIILITI